MAKKKRTGQTAIVRYRIDPIDEGGINLPQWDKKRIVLSGTVHFHNHLDLIAHIQGCPMNLLCRLVEVMDVTNTVYNTKQSRSAFIEFMKAITSNHIVYSDHTVKGAFGMLKNLGILISLGKASFRVNPEYFYKGRDTEKRLELVKNTLEFVARTPKVEEKPKPADLDGENVF